MTLDDARAEIYAALLPLVDVVDELQVSPYWNDTPSPPAVDFYPGTPFLDGAALGSVRDVRAYFTVRARVQMLDVVAGQSLLYRLLDPGDAASVEAALAEADWNVVPEGVSGFTQYADDVSATERMIGVEWRVSKFL